MSLVVQVIKSKMNKLRKKPLPIKLTLGLTFLCNSKCKSCNIWKIYRSTPERLKEELRLSDFKRLFDEIGTDVGWIEFTGGEPLLRNDVSEIISYAYNNTGIVAGGLTTNAVSPKPSLEAIIRILNKIPKHKLLNVGISLDGLKGIYDEIRGVSGNFDNAIWLFEKLKLLKKRHKNLAAHFAYTILGLNAGNFKTFYEFLKDNYDISIDETTITCEHFTGYYGKKRSRNPYKKYKNNITHDIQNYIKNLKRENRYSQDIFTRVKSAFYSFYAKNIPIFVANPKKMIIPCVAGEYSAYIDAYGNIYPCTQWDVKLGNLKENSFKETWWSNKARKVRKEIEVGECPNCWTPCEAQPSWVMNIGLFRAWW